ncbi:NACHT domain-containing protein [Spongiactinospora sp. 9N601]|uniref:NACHT domain-containing protein n=1 Tax=Spongiactinospora sp. 9N601 TaxID=3375149 RepID=UPI0037A848FE
MARSLSYGDAARLLGGGPEHRAVAALDRLTGGLLLTGTGTGVEFALSLFDAKGELARLCGELLSGLGDRLCGLRRYDRTERLEAARMIIMLTAFFEAVAESGVELPFTADELRMDRALQVGFVTRSSLPAARLGELVPMLVSVHKFGLSLGEGPNPGFPGLLQYYQHEGVQITYFLRELAELHGRADAIGPEFEQVMTSTVPELAVQRYEDLFLRLATEFPEVAFWTARAERAAIQQEVRDTRAGLARLGGVLASVADGRPPGERRQALAQRYQSVLTRPMVPSDEAADGFAVPSAGDAYIDPRYRAAGVSRGDPVDEESWWRDHPVRDSLQDFLIGHLTSTTAVMCPLIVLGLPGSGKSLLTKVLSARLPPSDFMVVRVVLREVPADTDLQSQIEYAIRDATGETLTWPAVSRAAGDALPVVLLDGFDELLQATGASQTDYLEHVVHFQEREADQGRPVAVMVTTRTAVADRARIPLVGAVAVRLEPFDDDQVRSWLEVWNKVNAPRVAARRLRPLPAEVALRHPELAGQPLLLFMLAVYDAADNALQRDDAGLDQAELYERILVRFAEREAGKIPGHDLTAEEELHRLSVVALAMFNRGRLWASEEEIDADLGALLGLAPARRPGSDFRRPVTPAQAAIGRFFFVHKAQAVQADVRLITCEFLHATFGEYLTARLLVRELEELGAAAGASRWRQRVDHGFLQAVLSFEPLTKRGQIIMFLTLLIAGLPKGTRTALRELLLISFHSALRPWAGSTGHDYAPADLPVPARHAAYSANLLLLAVLVGGPVTGRELFPEACHPVAEWRRHALLWKSQFGFEGWQGLVATLRLERTWHEDEREVVIGLGMGMALMPDPSWTYAFPPGGGWQLFDGEELRRENHFACDLGGDVAWHALEPFTATRPGDMFTTGFGAVHGSETESLAHALITLWTVSGDPYRADALEAAYARCLAHVPQPAVALELAMLSLVLRQMAADADRVSLGLRTRMHGLTHLHMMRFSGKEERLIREWLRDLNVPEGSERPELE